MQRLLLWGGGGKLLMSFLGPVAIGAVDFPVYKCARV